jgi:hypothetical protein
MQFVAIVTDGRVARRRGPLTLVTDRPDAQIEPTGFVVTPIAAMSSVAISEGLSLPALAGAPLQNALKFAGVNRAEPVALP